MIRRNALPATRFTTSLSGVLGAAGLVAASLALVPSGAHAQPAAAYPDKPVRIIVPFPPGGAADTFARLAGQKLSEAWGNKQVIIENRPGAGGIIGTEATAKAPADGYTFEMVTIGHAVNPYMYSKLPYDTKAELTPIAVIANVPSLVVVGPASQARPCATSSPPPRPKRMTSSTPPPASAAPATLARR